MRETLERLRRTKMALKGLLLAVAGVLLFVAGEFTERESGWASYLPLKEFGGLLFGAGVLGTWIDHLFQRDAEAARELQLRQLLKEHAPEMRDAVLDAFAANHDDLERVATPATLDRFITNSLALRLGDAEFADDVYGEVKRQAVEAPERWRDASIDVTVAAHPDHADLFEVTIRWEYETTPATMTRQFVCVDNRRDYLAHADAKTNTSAWMFTPNSHFGAADREAFELVAFNLNGEACEIKRTSRAGQQVYTAHLDQETVRRGEPVHLSYTGRTVVQRRGNRLIFELEKPTKNLAITLDYTDADLETISAVDLVSSVLPTRLEATPEGVTPKQLRVEIDGWSYPRSGVAFIWTLNSEAKASSKSGPVGKRKAVKAKSGGRS